MSLDNQGGEALQDRTARTTDGLRTAFLIAVAGAPTLFVFWLTTFAYERPYYIYGIDDGAYYYWPMLLAVGEQLGPLSHPGTPIVYLGHLLLGITSTSLERVQEFMDLSHLISALATSAAISFFSFRLLRRLEWGWRLLAIAAIVAWPTSLTYSNYLGPDAFIVAVGLPTLTALWMAISDTLRRARWMLWHGLGLGTCLAVKLSFLPFSIACVVAWLALAKLSRDDGPEGSPRVIRTAFAAIGGFALWMLPVIPRWPDLARNVLNTPESSGVGNLFAIMRFLTAESPAYLGIAVLIMGSLVVGVRLRRAAERTDDVSASTRRVKSVLLGAMSILFLIVLGGSTQSLAYEDPGVVVRNASPLALVLPFLVLHASERLTLPSFGSLLMGACAVSFWVQSLAAYVDFRSDLIRAATSVQADVYERMSDLSHTGRLAFWPNYDDLTGEPAFHLEGNLSYGSSRFDDLLAERFPRYTIFRLPDALFLARDAPVDRHPLGPLVDRWHELFGIEQENLSEPLVPSEAKYGPVSLIAFPISGHVDDQNVAEIGKIVREHFGSFREVRERIGDHDWVFLTLLER